MADTSRKVVPSLPAWNASFSERPGTSALADVEGGKTSATARSARGASARAPRIVGQR